MNIDAKTVAIPKTRLFRVELYAADEVAREHGWDINFAWVFATDEDEAETKLERNQGQRFDEVITCTECSEIVPLKGEFRVNTPDANLFIIAGPL